MKKTILAGIVIIIGCLVFLIIQQNLSRADITMDTYSKPYIVPFGEWVYVYLKVSYDINRNDYFVNVLVKPIGNKMRYYLRGECFNTKLGRDFYQNGVPEIKRGVEAACKQWTLQGYPISLNDFEFDIELK